MRILLIPGFMQGAGAWAPAAALLEAEHEVSALEHSEHTYEGRLARSPRRAQGAVLCGYSLGGRLALRAALRAPERTRR